VDKGRACTCPLWPCVYVSLMAVRVRVPYGRACTCPLRPCVYVSRMTARVRVPYGRACTYVSRTAARVRTCPVWPRVYVSRLAARVRVPYGRACTCPVCSEGARGWRWRAWSLVIGQWHGPLIHGDGSAMSWARLVGRPAVRPRTWHIVSSMAGSADNACSGRCVTR